MHMRSMCKRILYTDPIPPGSNGDKKAIIFFRDPSDGNLGKLTYPDPIDEDIETVPEGKRIKMSVVEEIVSDMNEAALTSYSAVGGIVIQVK
jgi:hypothetical protein